MTTLEPETASEPVEDDSGFPRYTFDQIIADYEWDDTFIRPENYEPEIMQLCGRTKAVLGIDGKGLIQELGAAMELAQSTFDNFYPDDKKKRELPYHNGTHAKMTTVFGVQMFLGALEKLTQNPEFGEYFKNNPDLAGKMAKTAIYSYALHEYRDWWTKGQDKKAVDDWDAHIKELLQAKGVEPDDIGIVLELDAFAKDLTGSVISTFQADFKPEFDLGSGRSRLSFLDSEKDTNFEVAVLNIYGACLRTADFGQAFNQSYSKRITLVDDSGEEIGGKVSYYGPYVLADEFRRRRPKAMPKEWVVRGEDGVDGGLALSNIGIERGFWEKFIKPNVRYGIEYMKLVNKDLYEDMKLTMERIESEFEVKDVNKPS